jgi:hypothetical protein
MGVASFLVPTQLSLGGGWWPLLAEGEGGGTGGLTCLIPNFSTVRNSRGGRFISGLNGGGALGQHRGIGPKQASCVVSDRFQYQVSSLSDRFGITYTVFGNSVQCTLSDLLPEPR